MRMFLSVSGHSSELSIDNHISRPTALQLKCDSDTISNWFENHQPRRQKSPPSFTLLSFKSRIKWPLGWPQPQVFRGYFFNSCNFQDNVHAFRLARLLRWQTLTWFFFKICRFRSSVLLSLLSKIPPSKLRNLQIVTYLKLKAIFSNVGPDLEMNQ